MRVRNVGDRVWSFGKAKGAAMGKKPQHLKPGEEITVTEENKDVLEKMMKMMPKHFVKLKDAAPEAPKAQVPAPAAQASAAAKAPAQAPVK